MKRSKSSTQTATNASKLHKHIGELLVSDDSPYKGYEIRQEYPVSSANPNYSSNRERFDWVILGLKVVIEVHGKQHYKPVCFGGMTIDEAKFNFLKRIDLDYKKQLAAEEAQYAYVVVKHTENKITIEELTDKIIEAMKAVTEDVRVPKEVKARIAGRAFQKQKGTAGWPKRKIQSAGFQKK